MIKITEKNMESIRGRVIKFFVKKPNRRFLVWESLNRHKSGKIDPWIGDINETPYCTYKVEKNYSQPRYSGNETSWRIYFESGEFQDIKIGDYIEFKSNRIICKFKYLEDIDGLYMYRVFEIYNGEDVERYIDSLNYFAKHLKIAAINGKYKNWNVDHTWLVLGSMFSPRYNYKSRMYENCTEDQLKRMLKARDLYSNIQDECCEIAGIVEETNDYDYDDCDYYDDDYDYYNDDGYDAYGYDDSGFNDEDFI